MPEGTPGLFCRLRLAERKQVTALCCTIANALALAEQLDPEAMHHLVHAFFALALHEVQRYQGHITQFLGDGFLALFGVPVVHEDHARRAVLAALGLQRCPRAGQTHLGPLRQEGFAVQIGIHTGLAVIGTLGDDGPTPYSVVGSTRHLATQLAQHAEPDTILITDATARQVRREVRLQTRGTVSLTSGATLAFEVLGIEPQGIAMSQFKARVLSRFVGRKREYTVLHDVLGQVARGHGHMVGVIGEAGAGKSRLLYEFLSSVHDTRIAYLEGRCRSSGSTIPCRPWLDILRQHCEITDTDRPETVREKVRNGLNAVGLDPDEGAPYLLQLLGVQAGAAPLAGRSRVPWGPTPAMGPTPARPTQAPRSGTTPATGTEPVSATLALSEAIRVTRLMHAWTIPALLETTNVIRLMHVRKGRTGVPRPLPPTTMATALQTIRMSAPIPI